MAYLPTYRLRLYRNFKAISTADYYGIVRYYEQFEEAIGTLDMEEYFDCTLAYTEALYEVGNYRQHLVMCDHLLELVIIQNIETWGGEDIYTKLLFRKAKSLYQQEEYPESAYILRELIKLQPRNPQPVRYLRGCLTRQKPEWLTKTRALAIAFTLLAAATIALEMFVVRPFFLDYYQAALLVHNILMVSAVLTFAGGEFWHGWRCHKEACLFAQKMLARKKASAKD